MSRVVFLYPIHRITSHHVSTQHTHSSAQRVDELCLSDDALPAAPHPFSLLLVPRSFSCSGLLSLIPLRLRSSISVVSEVKQLVLLLWLLKSVLSVWSVHSAADSRGSSRRHDAADKQRQEKRQATRYNDRREEWTRQGHGKRTTTDNSGLDAMTERWNDGCNFFQFDSTSSPLPSSSDLMLHPHPSSTSSFLPTPYHIIRSHEHCSSSLDWTAGVFD